MFGALFLKSAELPKAFPFEGGRKLQAVWCRRRRMRAKSSFRLPPNKRDSRTFCHHAASLQTYKRCFPFSVGEKRRKERRIKVVVVVVGGVETVEKPKIPQKPVPEGLFGGFEDNPDRKTDPETV